MGILTTSLVLGATTGFLWALRKWRESQWQGITTVERLDGKVVVLTGATSGLGKATAEDLASRGATIVLACRNVEAAQEVVNTIKLKYPDVEMGVVELDLGSLESVKKCAANILEKYPQINILINNAGVSVPPAKGIKTIDGYEINFGVNHLGHFLLTNLLLDRIKESRPSRIVIVTSKLHEQGILDLEALEGKKPSLKKQGRNSAYSNSKLANVHFGLKLAEKTRGSGINVYMVCPGWNYTQLFRYSQFPWYYWIPVLPIAFWFMRPARLGIRSIVYCTASEKAENETGLFYRECKVYNSSADLNPDTATALWELSCKLCNETF